MMRYGVSLEWLLYDLTTTYLEVLCALCASAVNSYILSKLELPHLTV